MTRTVAVIDTKLMLDIYEQTQGDILLRAEQAPEILMRQGVGPVTIVAAVKRLLVLRELLGDQPELAELYSQRTLFVACGRCELIEPPANLSMPEEAMFDLEKFKQEASRAEL